jgi:triacylglycerol lipase
MNRSNVDERIHVILVPGFGAFDALGRVEYYSGITHLFDSWTRRHSCRVTLHYFDNLPTAPVTARARRLRMYLAKRMARGEILEADKIVLVGHSTGGLDIRQLICDLAKSEHERSHVDGGHPVNNKAIREKLKAVVFLSVPHWGTNIADWVRSHGALRKAIVGELRAVVTGSQVPVLDAIETQITATAATLTDAGILLALKDALTEANERYGRPSPLRSAEAQDAAADLGLYFRQMWSDFAVIYDLACHSSDPERRSPAQFNENERAEELTLWDHPPIRTLSYATVGGRPFSFPGGEPAPAFELTSPGSYLDLIKDFWATAKNDFSYRLCYRACAGGPFQVPPGSGKKLRVIGPQHPPQPLETWDNDGIVNTASMLWPKGKVFLVLADHLDIVGHYRLRKAQRPTRVDAAYGMPREYQAYDCLQSSPRFTKAVFERVWNSIFDFAVESAGAGRKASKSKPMKLAAAA